jgi:chemotaxis protein CheZ
VPDQPEQNISVLREELNGLLRYLQRVRMEIASIDRPAEGEHGFNSMGDQLDAIVEATETATNTIMEAVEKNDDVVQNIRNKVSDPEINAMLDQINANSGDVFEACSFQDITGQRVNKVIKSITYVEERVNALIDVMGRDTIKEAEVLPEEQKTEDEKLLAGPQLEGKGLSQDDIDSLFD